METITKNLNYSLRNNNIFTPRAGREIALPEKKPFNQFTRTVLNRLTWVISRIRSIYRIYADSVILLASELVINIFITVLSIRYTTP